MTLPLSTSQIIHRRRGRALRQQQAAQTRRFWSWVFGIAFVVAVVLPVGGLGGVALAVYAGATRVLPPAGVPLPVAVRAMGQANAGRATVFYDRTDTTQVYQSRDPLSPDTWVSLDTLPSYVVSAALISEDPDFLTAPQSNLVAALVRLWQQILVGGVPADDTITGRLVRDVALALPPADAQASTGSDLLERALALGDARSREIALVSEINRRYSPRAILEWHLNTGDYGGNQTSSVGDAFGIEAAAQLYLGKRAVDLTLADAAFLLAIPPAPQYNPIADEVAARARGVDLLRMMFDAGEIGEAAFNEAASAIQNDLVIRSNPDLLPAMAPEYIGYARAQAATLLDGLGMNGAQEMARGSLRITTTLDLDMQRQAECARDAALARLNAAPVPSLMEDGTACIAAAGLPAPSVRFSIGEQVAGAAPDRGTVVMLDARTSELRALVGDGLSAAYPPSITLLPFVYFEGFNGGSGGLVTPATMLYDVPRSFPGSEEGLIYTVTDPDGRTRGPLDARTALGAGLLPPAADIAYRQGMSSVLRTAHQMGINSLEENGFDLMLLERGGAVSALDLAYAYSVFAAMGDMRGVSVPPIANGYRARDPAAILKIADAQGRVLWAYDPDAAAACRGPAFCTPLLEQGLAFLINDILADVETRWGETGRGSTLELPGREAGVINGLSDDRADNWTIGYTPQFVTLAHLYRADRTPLALPTYALDGAAALWRAMMDYAHLRDAEPAAGWARPERITEAVVCQTSGLAPNGVCPTREEIFIDGTQPRARDTYWQNFEVNRETGQLATVNTPPAQRTTQRYFVPPAEVRVWWEENDQPLPPTEVDTVSVAPNNQLARAVRITSPSAYSYIGGEVDILGTINASNVQFFQLSFGQGLNPSTWINLTAPQQAVSEVANAPLTTWNTAGLDGLYSLRLVLTRADDSVESDTLLVTIDNAAPSLTLDSAEPGQLYRWPRDTQVEVVAEAIDNLIVQRVDFYHGNEYLGADESWPFSFTWTINAPGTEIFSAVAFDAVGNSARAELTVEIIRAGS